MIDKATNAWRADGRPTSVDPDYDPDEDHDRNGDLDDARKRAQRSRQRYLDQLQNSWRRPARMVTGFGPNVVGAGPDVNPLRTIDHTFNLRHG
jgi:hypothetical protein